MLTKKLQKEALDHIESDDWEDWFNQLSSQQQKLVGQFAMSIFTSTSADRTPSKHARMQTK